MQSKNFVEDFFFVKLRYSNIQNLLSIPFLHQVQIFGSLMCVQKALSNIFKASPNKIGHDFMDIYCMSKSLAPIYRIMYYIKKWSRLLGHKEL